MADLIPGGTLLIRVEALKRCVAKSELAAEVVANIATIKPYQSVESRHEKVALDVSHGNTDSEHSAAVILSENPLVDGVFSRLNPRTVLVYPGDKLEVVLDVTLPKGDDFTHAGTSDAALVYPAIAKYPSATRNLAIERNTITVATDVSAVLSLGNMESEAALSVMNGEATLFKQFANVGTCPAHLDDQHTEETFSIGEAASPICEDVNLEYIAAHKRFETGDKQRGSFNCPKFQGATHGMLEDFLAAVKNAPRTAGSPIGSAHVVFLEIRSVWSAIIQLFFPQCTIHILVCDKRDALFAAQNHPDAPHACVAYRTDQPGCEAALHNTIVGVDIFSGVRALNLLGKEQIHRRRQNPLRTRVSRSRNRSGFRGKTCRHYFHGPQRFPEPAKVLGYPKGSQLHTCVEYGGGHSWRESDDVLNAIFPIPSVFGLNVISDVVAALVGATVSD